MIDNNPSPTATDTGGPEARFSAGPPARKDDDHAHEHRNPPQRHERLLPSLRSRALGDAAQAVRRATPPRRVLAQWRRHHTGECGRRPVGGERSGQRSGARLMPRWATRLHAWVYQRSGGRFLGRMGGQPVLLLQTTGRRSGRTHTTPVQYLTNDDTFVVVASNAGAANPPGLVPQSARQPARRNRDRSEHHRRSGTRGHRPRTRGTLATTDGRQPLPGARRAQGRTRPAPYGPHRRRLRGKPPTARHDDACTRAPLHLRQRP
jgi:deazaflavin-dependent oxidoreductase (nitroreductase family)